MRERDLAPDERHACAGISNGSAEHSRIRDFRGYLDRIKMRSTDPRAYTTVVRAARFLEHDGHEQEQPRVLPEVLGEGAYL